MGAKQFKLASVAEVAYPRVTITAPRGLVYYTISVTTMSGNGSVADELCVTARLELC